MSKQVSITIGIPAHNEGSNIGLLIRDVLAQTQDDFKIKQIIVSSDGSSDDTVDVCKKIADPRIIVLANADRQGITRGLNQIISKTTGDVLVTLDADVRILDKKCIAKLIRPITDNLADLTSSAIKEIKPNSFFSQVLHVSMHLKTVLFDSINGGNNIYTCHGLARAYSKRFFKSLKFMVSIGNDMYSYLACLDKGYVYRYVPEAVAWYRLPGTYDDHRKQSLRFFNSSSQQENYFNKEQIRQHTMIPKKAYLVAGIRALPILLRYPIHAIAYFGIQLSLRYQSKFYSPKQAWEMVTSTKNI